MIIDMKKEPMDSAIGRAVRAQRIARKVGVEKAARQLGVAKARYKACEEGYFAFQVADLYGLAELFGCRVGDLMPDEGALAGVDDHQRYGDPEEVRDIIHYFSGVVSPVMRAHFLRQIQAASVNGLISSGRGKAARRRASGKSSSPFRFLRVS